MEQLNSASIYIRQWFTVNDIANMLEVTRDTVRRWIRTKKLYAVKEKGVKGYSVNGLVLRKFILDNKPEYEKALTNTVKIRYTTELIVLTGALSAKSISKWFVEKFKERRKNKEQNESEN